MAGFNWKPLLLACLIVSIGQLSLGLVFPALPAVAQSLHLSTEQVQLLVSGYLFSFGASQLIYGPLSDVFGRRPVLLSGLLIAACGLAIGVLQAGSFQWLLLGRIIQGMGAGSVAVLARATIRDSYQRQDLVKAMTWVAIVAAFTPIMAPVCRWHRQPPLWLADCLRLAARLYRRCLVIIVALLQRNPSNDPTATIGGTAGKILFFVNPRASLPVLCRYRLGELRTGCPIYFNDAIYHAGPDRDEFRTLRPLGNGACTRLALRRPGLPTVASAIGHAKDAHALPTIALCRRLGVDRSSSFTILDGHRPLPDGNG